MEDRKEKYCLGFSDCVIYACEMSASDFFFLKKMLILARDEIKVRE